MTLQKDKKKLLLMQKDHSAKVEKFNKMSAQKIKFAQTRRQEAERLERANQLGLNADEGRLVGRKSAVNTKLENDLGDMRQEEQALVEEAVRRFQEGYVTHASSTFRDKRISTTDADGCIPRMRSGSATRDRLGSLATWDAVTLPPPFVDAWRRESIAIGLLRNPNAPAQSVVPPSVPRAESAVRRRSYFLVEELSTASKLDKRDSVVPSQPTRLTEMTLPEITGAVKLITLESEATTRIATLSSPMPVSSVSDEPLTSARVRKQREILKN